MSNIRYKREYDKIDDTDYNIIKTLLKNMYKDMTDIIDVEYTIKDLRIYDGDKITIECYFEYKNDK